MPDTETYYTRYDPWAVTPQIETVSGSPPDAAAPPKSAKAGELTSAQVSGARATADGYGISLACLASGVTATGRPAVQAGTWDTYRAMSRQPTLALAIAAANAPVRAAGLAWQAKDDAPGDALDFLRDMLDPMWPFVAAECLRSREFGYRGFEKCYDTDAGATVLRKLKVLMPELTTIRAYETGGFAGFQQDREGGTPLVLGLEKSFLYTHGKDGDDHYGMPLHENSREAYSNWLATIDNGFRCQKKLAGVIIQLHYPPGKTDIDGVSTDNSVIARTILDNIGHTNSVAIPNLLATEDAARAGSAEGRPQWVLSTVDVGKASEGLTAIGGDAKYWDTMMLRGWLVPERAVTEGQFGTKAEAEAHADILLAVGDQQSKDIARTVNWHVIDPLLIYNYGPEARGSVFVECEPIIDKKRGAIREMLALLLADPSIRAETRRQLQFKAMLESYNLPLNDAIDIDDEVPDEPPEPVAAVPVNGNGDRFGNGDETRLSRLLGMGE